MGGIADKKCMDLWEGFFLFFVDLRMKSGIIRVILLGGLAGDEKKGIFSQASPNLVPEILSWKGSVYSVRLRVDEVWFLCDYVFFFSFG